MDAHKLVLGITGMPASGKNELLKFVKARDFNLQIVQPKKIIAKDMKAGQLSLSQFIHYVKLDADSVDMGQVIKKKMEEDKVPITSENVREYATKLRDTHGLDVVSKMCVPTIESILEKGKAVLIEDIKGWVEVKYFREKFGNDFVLLAIHTPPAMRFERSLNREPGWDKKTMQTAEQFNWRDEKELGWGLGNAIAMADYVIVNDGSVENFKKNVEKLFSTLLRRKK